MPLDRFREAELGTLTKALLPLKESALPNLPAPAPAQVAFESVPALPLPDWSAAVVPLPASKPYAATSPVVGGVGDGRACFVRGRADVARRVLGGDLVVVGAGREAGVRVAGAGRLRDPVRRRGGEAGGRRAVDVVVVDSAGVARGAPAERGLPRRASRGQKRRQRSAASCPRSPSRSPRSRPGRRCRPRPRR